MAHHAPHIFSHFFWVTAVVLLMESAPFVQTHDVTDGSPTVPDNQDSAIDWAELTRTDLQAAYEITLENHPGVYNDLDPDFKALAVDALEKALSLSDQVKNAAGYKYALDAFAADFQDGHFRFQQIMETSEDGRLGEWPGFARTRPSGFYYQPDIPYPELDLSRAAVEAWLV